MFHNPFKTLNKPDYILWIISMTVVTISSLFSNSVDYLNLVASLLGVTALIFIAKGHYFGQLLTVIFALLYSIVSVKCKYYGEMITYLFMSAPIALFSMISWIRHPYKDNSEEVKIRAISGPLKAFVIALSIIVTFLFYFILKYFNNANLLVSTVSVTTSFMASALMFLRNPYYALAYAANDVVLIILWISMSLSDLKYLSFVACFLMFLINDIYGFVQWKIRQKSQMKGL